MNRSLFGLAVAPLAATLLLMVPLALLDRSAVIPLGAFLLPAAYVTAAVLGMPAHLLLSRRAWQRRWHYAVAGGILGLFGAAVVVWIVPAEVKRAASMIAAILGVPGGVLGGLVFWSLSVKSPAVEPGPNNASEHTRGL